MRHITVYCGASQGRRPSHRLAATEFGRLIAESGLGLVYGGASTGLMGAVADAALAGGAPVTGVIPEDLVRHEVAHPGLTRLETVSSMHERKARMVELGDAFVALPGGFGTADEFFEVLTWAQLGLHGKPCALLDTDGFFQPLLTFLRHAADEGFVHQRYLDNIIVSAHPQEILESFSSHRALPHLFAAA
ncbi:MULTISPECIES: LOG family protein [Kitasatospora]|uniref:Cytokinin riboside 5'-monophosphate phosphoribohydrolase n=1 Tax=Kitasatospora cystarginea TaxID=58350 RepID=A0ABN3DRY2_9ACTN